MNEAPKGNYIFDPPIKRHEWLSILELLEEYHPQITWTGGERHLLDAHTLNDYEEGFGETTEVYGISIDNQNNFRTIGNDSWGRRGGYAAMDNMVSMGKPKDGREFFGLDFNTDDFFNMFESTNIKRIIREEIDSDWDFMGDVSPYTGISIRDLTKLLSRGDAFDISTECECTCDDGEEYGNTYYRKVDFPKYLEMEHNNSDFVLVLKDGSALNIWFDGDLGFHGYPNLGGYFDEHDLDFDDLDELTKQNGLYGEFKKRIPELETLYFMEL